MACLGLPLVAVLVVGLVMSIVGRKHCPGGFRLVRITSTGLEMGEGRESLDRIPWDRIAYARVQYLTVNGSPENTLQIHLRGGKTIELNEGYDLPLERLCRLIDPES
jgi:hypothetical protein